MLRLLIDPLAGEAGLPLVDLPKGVRVRRSAIREFTLNYNHIAVFVPHLGATLNAASWHVTALGG